MRSLVVLQTQIRHNLRCRVSSHSCRQSGSRLEEAQRDQLLLLGKEELPAELTAKVDESEIEDELADLEDSDVLLPPDLVAGSGGPVVVVHDDMH